MFYFFSISISLSISICTLPVLSGNEIYGMIPVTSQFPTGCPRAYPCTYPYSSLWSSLDFCLNILPLSRGSIPWDLCGFNTWSYTTVNIFHSDYLSVIKFVKAIKVNKFMNINGKVVIYLDFYRIWLLKGLLIDKYC